VTSPAKLTSPALASAVAKPAEVHEVGEVLEVHDLKTAGGFFFEGEGGVVKAGRRGAKGDEVVNVHDGIPGAERAEPGRTEDVAVEVPGVVVRRFGGPEAQAQETAGTAGARVIHALGVKAEGTAELLPAGAAHHVEVLGTGVRGERRPEQGQAKNRTHVLRTMRRPAPFREEAGVSDVI
jgi:hypothetical protein